MIYSGLEAIYSWSSTTSNTLLYRLREQTKHNHKRQLMFVDVLTIGFAPGCLFLFFPSFLLCFILSLLLLWLCFIFLNSKLLCSLLTLFPHITRACTPSMSDSTTTVTCLSIKYLCLNGSCLYKYDRLQIPYN